jgi:uncharacterized protein
VPSRLAGLPLREWQDVLVHDADTRRARLLGLAFLDELPSGVGLHLPHTRSIHTFGMRFALDLHWIGQWGDVVRIDRRVPPRRLRGCREAASVIEFASQAA